MPQIRPVTDLRNTTAISDLCIASNEPIFTTENEDGDLVIMNIETNEREMTMSDIYQKLTIAEKQIQNSELLDGDEVFAKLRGKYGGKYELKVTLADGCDLDHICEDNV